MGEDWDIAPELLRRLLRYEPDTGKLFWRERTLDMFHREPDFRTWNTRFAGKEAFTAASGRVYRHGAILGKTFKAHRVIWALVHGRWPAGEIDHIDGDPGNNRIANLRDVTPAVNQRNTRMKSHNASGSNGVEWIERVAKWQARGFLDGKHIYLGRFTDKAAAIAARQAFNEANGFTERHGK